MPNTAEQSSQSLVSAQSSMAPPATPLSSSRRTSGKGKAPKRAAGGTAAARVRGGSSVVDLTGDSTRPVVASLQRSGQRPTHAKWTEKRTLVLVKVATRISGTLRMGATITDWGKELVDAWREETGEDHQSVARHFKDVIKKRLSERKDSREDASGEENSSELKRRLDIFLDETWLPRLEQQECSKQGKDTERERARWEALDRQRIMMGRGRDSQRADSSSEASSDEEDEVIDGEAGGEAGSEEGPSNSTPALAYQPSQSPSIPSTPAPPRSTPTPSGSQSSAPKRSTKEKQQIGRFLENAGDWFEYDRKRSEVETQRSTLLENSVKGLEERTESLATTLGAMREENKAMMAMLGRLTDSMSYHPPPQPQIYRPEVGQYPGWK